MISDIELQRDRCGIVELMRKMADGQVGIADFINATGCRVGAFARLKVDASGKWTATSKGKLHSGVVNGEIAYNFVGAMQCPNAPNRWNLGAEVCVPATLSSGGQCTCSYSYEN